MNRELKHPVLQSSERGDIQRPVSATQQVYRELRRQIIVGDIAPAKRLKIESLKVSLNTGASPIREALSLLTSDQLVERIDQRGFRTAPVSRDHFHEILMLRCQLEEMAFRKSMQSGSERWEENVVLAHHSLSKCRRSGASEYETCHKDFHMSLLSACGSPILYRFCAQLYDLNIRYRYLAGKSVRYVKRNVFDEHKSILAAVTESDEHNAVQQLLSHYRLTGEFLGELFEKESLLDKQVAS